MSGLDKIVAQNVEYDNTVSGMTADDVQEAIDEIGAASIIINAKVQYFANLPAAASHSGETYYVEEYSSNAGVDYLSGLYLSNGTSWTFRDDKIVYSLTAFTGTNKILKTNDTNKEIVETLVEIDSNNNIDLKNAGLKDINVSTAVKLGSATDTSLNTTKKDILGGINENKSNIDQVMTDLGNKTDTDGSNATFNNLNNTAKDNILSSVLGGLQTTDNTKVGYILLFKDNDTAPTNNRYTLPEGGTWFVNISCAGAGSFFGLGAGGRIVAGGTSIAVDSRTQAIYGFAIKIA